MSKVVKHSRNKKQKTREHEHLTMSKTGYIPGSTDKPINIKLSKR